MSQRRASSVPGWAQAPRTCRVGFTLVELLTVIAIIALLIAILMPSLSAARNQAKNLKTSALLRAISAGLEMFKNENEIEFRQSNGYPPSAGYSWAGKCDTGPRSDVHEATPPDPNILYGAHWLPRFLMGKDLQGFVQRKAVPAALWVETEGAWDCAPAAEWYNPAPDKNNKKPLDRVGPYVNPDSVELVPTNELPGTLSTDSVDLIALSKVPVIVDSFGRPVLYYVANPNGWVLAAQQEPTSTGDPGGIFVQKDNEGFTGNDPESKKGWLFGTKPHEIARFGDPAPELIDQDENLQSFAYYICDHKILEATGTDLKTRTVRGFRTDSFLLITAGKDGIYGNKDDVNNFDQKQ